MGAPSRRAGTTRTRVTDMARVELPIALLELHQALGVGASVELVLADDVAEGPEAVRRTSGWHDIVIGAGFAVTEARARGGEVLVTATRLRTLPDVVGPDMHVLVCGLNPSEYAADRGVGFARPGNRFWPAAHESGLVSRDRDPRHALEHHGVGMTDLVKRASARADGLRVDEYRDGVERLARLVRWLAPNAVCFAGLAGYRAAIDRHASAGPVDAGFAGAAAYVMPNPSGVNAHATLDDLVGHLRAVRALAGAPRRLR